MPIRISSAVHAALLAEAEAAGSRECCGLLFGESPDAIDALRPTPNRADDPSSHFEIEPAALIDAERSARQGGPRLLGYYHSHPNGRTEPSATDAGQSAGDDRLWLIIAGGRIAAWRNRPGGTHLGRFEPVELELD